ncbi:MAG: hypothetical protein K2W92_08425 [Alphaproteobacteria bacterium]|nr:hypothetical protein [Alphaproteobacteria bacterium]
MQFLKINAKNNFIGLFQPIFLKKGGLMIRNVIRYFLVITGSVVISNACISMQNEEDDLETRARHSMSIVHDYIRAHGRMVDGDDNTPCPTLTFEVSWAKIGLADDNASLLKRAIELKKIPISVRVIATDKRDKEIWSTERNDI